MKWGKRWVKGSVQVWIAPGLFYSKESVLRNAVISRKRGHDSAFGSVDIVLENLEVWSHRVIKGLLQRAVIMLATLGHVCVGVGDNETVGNAGIKEVRAAGAWLGGWGGAGLIPSMRPTC